MIVQDANYWNAVVDLENKLSDTLMATEVLTDRPFRRIPMRTFAQDLVELVASNLTPISQQHLTS